MRSSDAIAEKRCEVAIQTVLELVSFLEAEALWDLVEASHAIIGLLREGNVSAAWDLCYAMDPGNRPNSVGRIPDRLLERWTILEYLLCSLTTGSEDRVQEAPD